MSTVEQSIVVDVPVSTAYNQWTQFETFPEFMAGVERVEQVSPTKTHWVTEIAGQTREFDAEVTEQHPDHRVVWKSTDGTTHAGVVTFHRLDEARTRLMLQMDYEPDGIVEHAGDTLGFVERRVRGDLERFKRFIESRGDEALP